MYTLITQLSGAIMQGIQGKRMLRGILEDFVVLYKVQWNELLVLLAVLTANIDSLLWLTLCQTTFESAERAKRTSG